MPHSPLHERNQKFADINTSLHIISIHFLSPQPIDGFSSVQTGWLGGGFVKVSVLYIHLLIETMLQNFPSMNYRQPTSTSTVQILAEPANKFLNPK